MDYGRHGNNFVKKFIAAAKQKNRLRVVDDQTGSPTATTQAAEVICSLVRNRTAGIFHFASAGYVNRYEMAKELIGCVVTSKIFDVMKNKEEFNLQRFVDALNKLPELPWN